MHRQPARFAGRIEVLRRSGDAAGFRQLAGELGINPPILAHRYALSLDVDTLVLGIKNRQELADGIAAAEAGPLPGNLIARIDRSGDRGPD
jgi:aryl-alcohol dehydrogenase-like predicted oxidoreductase